MSEQNSNHTISKCYQLFSPTQDKLSFSSVGKNAIWDWQAGCWFFQFKFDADQVAEKYNHNGHKFLVKETISEIADTLINGTNAQKKEIRERAKYERKYQKLYDDKKEFLKECEFCKFSDSDFSYDPSPEMTGLELKRFYSLKDKYSYFKKQEEKLEGEFLKCQELEEKARLSTLSEEFASKKKIKMNGLPEIRIIEGEIYNMVDSAEKILISKELGVYQRSGQLVRIIKEVSKTKKKSEIKRDANALLISQISPNSLCEILAKNANWTKYNEQKADWILRDCPEKVALTLIDRKEWNLPYLAGIIQAPTLRADGSILEDPGYDDDTGLFFDPGLTKFKKVRVDPGIEEAKEALDVILNILKYFPFEIAEGEKDKFKSTSLSVAVSAILTALIRKSLRSAPLHGFSAPKMGSGKSLLADVVGLISTGKLNSVISQAPDETEEQKRLITILSEGDQIVCYDNIERAFGSSALCSALTQESYKGRLLGINKNLTVSSEVTFLATGNNLTFIGDISTRVILCKLDPKMDNPEERSFDVDLKKYIPEHRGELVQAGLTILRAYHVARRPKQDMKQLGRFEDWSDWVRAAIIWVGMADPCDSRKDIENCDPERQKLINLLVNWYEVVGDLPIRTRDIISKSEKNDALQDSLKSIAEKNGEICSIRLGISLKKYSNRSEKGLYVQKNGTYNNADLWQVKKT